MNNKKRIYLEIESKRRELYSRIYFAIKAAKNWSSNKNLGHLLSDTSLGIEVLTYNGSWRTVQYS